MPGDYAQLAGLQEKFKKFADGRAQAALAKAIANEAVTQALLSFRESRDPYGLPWAPLKHRVGKPLLLTGRLRSSIAVQAVSPTSFRIGTNVSYAVFHQQGVDARYRRKARSQAMLVHDRGKRRGQFAKFRSAKQAESLGGRTLHFGERDMHLVIPRRQFIAEGKLGPIWTKAFIDASNRTMERLLGSGAA